MTKYQQGVKAEYAARDQLQADGFYVIRAAGSHGLADLVAVGAKRVKLVQIKSTVKDKPRYTDELDALRDWVVPDNCDKELWVWMKHKRAWVILPV